MNEKDVRDRAYKLLTMEGIPEANLRLDNYPYQFLGGTRQKAMLAMALS
jgi:oligopeptide transport system ATP-binding protein